MAAPSPASAARAAAADGSSGWFGGRLVPRTAGELRRQRQLVAAGLVVLVLLGVGLAVVGWKQVRASTPGQYVDPSLRPDEPGYVALVTPTPTLLVVHQDSDGNLAGVALLALRSRDEGGSVILMPAATRAPAGDEGRTLSSAYAEGGAAAVAEAVEEVLNVAVSTPVELDDAGWSRLIAPVAPLELELGGPVADWPAGELSLSADQAGAFLSARNADEEELSRLGRQEQFWQAWLDAVANGGADAIPGEEDVGLGRFLQGLTEGPVTVSGLPVAQDPQVFEEAYLPDEALVAVLVASEVPYPQEPSPGSRIRVRLLNGTGDGDLNVWAVAPLVEAGAEIAMSGNADSFSVSRTRIVYNDDDLRDEARRLSGALGFGDVEAGRGTEAEAEATAPEEESERVDVTVILGADALTAMRRSESTE